MNIDAAFQGTLEAALRAIFEHFPIAGSPNESQTEDDLIWPVLAQLDWTATLRQQNLSARGREDVPDGSLFADDAAKHRANGFPEEWRRYGLGLAVVESKRWLRPLDRRSERQGEETAPSTQMLRYLRRVDDLTAGALRSFWFTCRTADRDGPDHPHLDFQALVLSEDLPVIEAQEPPEIPVPFEEYSALAVCRTLRAPFSYLAEKCRYS